MKDWRPTGVRSYSGYRADERPISFDFEGRELRVLTVLERSRGPDHQRFKVLAEDEMVYIVKHHEPTDMWTVKQAAGR